jgi:uncharacterized protein with von Willebrand factor type A (vWA) domain
MAWHHSALGSKRFVYFPVDKEGQKQRQDSESKGELTDNLLDKLLKAIGREALKEKTPSLQELEQSLQGLMSSLSGQHEDRQQQQKSGSMVDSRGEDVDDSGMPLIRYLMQKGYLKDSPKWLSAKGFIAIGGKMLSDVMKALKAGEYGTHESKNLGSGSLLLDATKKYEPGDDIRLLNVPKSLLNTIQRTLKNGGDLKLPLQIDEQNRGR